ncbi:MAG: hypothetical protein MHM6MM_005140 [Cercozoa sp. M6MM]
MRALHVSQRLYRAARRLNSQLVDELPSPGSSGAKSSANLGPALVDAINAYVAHYRVPIAMTLTALASSVYLVTHQQTQQVRQELKAEMKSFKDEMKAEMTSFKNEMKAEMTSFKNEMKREFAAHEQRIFALVSIQRGAAAVQMDGKLRFTQLSVSAHCTLGTHPLTEPHKSTEDDDLGPE